MAVVSREARALEFGRLVEEYRSGGASAREFAAREGISVATFYRWLSRLSPDGTVQALQGLDEQPSVAQERPKPPPLRIARVIRMASSESDANTSTSTSSAIIIEAGGVRVEVQSGFERDTLTAVLDILEARGGRGGA